MRATPEEHARRAYVDATLPSDDLRRRLRARIRARDRRPWIPGALAALALTVAAAALVLALRSPVGPSLPELPDYVHVQLDGEGSIGGTSSAPRLTWRSGTLHVEVEPNRGVDLTVTTDEAVVRVVGTVFDVHRAHFATEVTVDHGRVSVTCVGESERFVTDGERVRCLPNDLPTLLRRVTSLGAVSAAPEERLSSLDRAAALAESGTSAHGELLAHRVQALVDAGRPGEALEFAEAYVDAGYATRRADLLAFVVHSRYEREQCGVRERLEEAVRSLPPGPEWLLLASCLTSEDPARARNLIDAAMPVVQDAWAELAAELAARLPEAPPR